MTSVNEFIANTSDKIQKIFSSPPKISDINLELRLPEKEYQPFFLKIVQDFIKHHNLPSDLPMPEGNIQIHLALSMILDVMVRSMGDEKRKEILKELEDYKLSVPVKYR